MFDRLFRHFCRSPGSWVGTTVSAFVVLATAYNVALLQGGQHPAPLTFGFGAGEARDEPPPVIARPTKRVLVPDAASIEELVTGPDAVADLQILEIQTELQSLSLYDGPLDGLMGPRTQTAIRAFESGAGMPVSGLASDILLRRLRRFSGSLAATTATAVPSLDGGPALEPGSDPRVLAVQRALAEIGYAPGALDGLMGRATRDAITAFEADRGMAPTGQLSDGLVRELEAYMGRPLV